MNPTLRNILAVIAGWIVGSVVNAGIVVLGQRIYPIAGIKAKSSDELAAIMLGLDFNYFIFPFLAHALGTLVGSIIAASTAVCQKMKSGMAVGVLYLIGGIIACFMIPAPNWFIATDLILAYIPMAWIGGIIGKRISFK